MAKTRQELNEYAYEYAKEKLKRIPLDVKKEDFEVIKKHADAVGESVNGYIKNAIKIRIDSEPLE